jgi:SAM-dependent methyltransferase
MKFAYKEQFRTSRGIQQRRKRVHPFSRAWYKSHHASNQKMLLSPTWKLQTARIVLPLPSKFIYLLSLSLLSAMSDPVPTSATSSTETTFRSYSEEQGKSYAKYRLSYHDSVYKAVMDYHLTNGAQLDTILDVGCGPGTALRDLAPSFTHAVGLDPSQGMISTAKSLGGESANSTPIRFSLSAAEELGCSTCLPIPDGSVDLIIAASSAHWFDMSKFWPRAARVLKPGGSVAIWGGGCLRVDPATPNHVAVQTAIDKLSLQVEGCMEPGNRMARGLYADMPLPWSLGMPVAGFDKSSFLRREWNTGGRYGPEDHFFSNQQPVDLDSLEQILGTDSPVTRWREAHPDAEGTERDVVRIMRHEIELALQDAGIEKGKEMLKGGVQGVLLLVRKKR